MVTVSVSLQKGRGAAKKAHGLLQGNRRGRSEQICSKGRRWPRPGQGYQTVGAMKSEPVYPEIHG